MLDLRHPFFPAFERLMTEAATHAPVYDLGTSSRFAKEVGLVRHLFDKENYRAGGYRPDLSLGVDACDFDCDIQQLSGIADGEAGSVLCISVLEHLWEPAVTLAEFYRVLKPGGQCLINVPSWRGKDFLEFSAFRLGLSFPAEMDDHKMYYDPRDLWPLLVGAGFLPSQIKCFRHKFGLNTFAACRKGQ